MAQLVDKIQEWGLEALEVLGAWVRLWRWGYPPLEEGRKEKEW